MITGSVITRGRDLGVGEKFSISPDTRSNKFKHDLATIFTLKVFEDIY